MSVRAIGLGLLVLGSCAPDESFQFGFHAAWQVPCELPGRCHSGHNCGPQDLPWFAGPHERFDERDAARLARESLAWFESSSDAALWRGNAGARLELVYPSQALEITASMGSSATWEGELRTWLERFALGGEGCDESSPEFFAWRVDFGDRGAVRGHADDEALAVEQMRALADSAGPAGASPSFKLSRAVRRSSHQMDVYVVDAADAAELDGLPLQLREKVARYAQE